MTNPSRLSIQGTTDLIETITTLTAEHQAFLSRHRLMRIALRIGLRSLAGLDHDGLRGAIIEDHEAMRTPLRAAL